MRFKADLAAGLDATGVSDVEFLSLSVMDRIDLSR